jgi:signal transduction histidine kinase
MLSVDIAMPTVQIDSGLIARVLGNLVSNAINYTPNGKTIVVQTLVAIDAQSVSFTVADEGIGIDATDLPYIFERFYRTARARKEQFAGTGLGLAIVKEIVELHGGEVSVESELGRGSVFTVRLPLVS